jgi:hypothetical protein
MASRFWVGGTGTWDAVTTTHWAASSGGAGGQTVPGSGDAVTFDGSSGGGTVTVNTTITVQQIVCGAFTGTLDFSAHNNSVTLNQSSGFSGSGAGTRTINLGNGTWTLSAAAANWTMTTTTGLTFNANSSTISFTGDTPGSQNRVFAGGGLTYSTVTIGATSVGGGPLQIAGANTFATLNISGSNAIIFPTGVTQTITNAFTWTGSSAGTLFLTSNNLFTNATISVATGSPTMSWASLHDLTFSGGATFTATNSFNSGGNSGITITAPLLGPSRARIASGF